MMHGREKSDLAMGAMKPANKANEPTAEASTGANAAEPVERRAGAKGNAHQQSTHWTQSQARVSQALERIRQAIAVIHPRWEPYAGKPPVRFCAGGAMKIASLPLRRREFFTLLGGAAAAWPLAARGQQEPVRRVVVLVGAAETASSRGWLTAFSRRLDELGWREGRNLVTQVQWWNDQPEQMRAWAAELIARSPDVAVTYTNLALAVLKPIARNVPIVFVGVGDPVGGGFVSSLARPGGNITGFASYEPSMGGKWLEVLRETAPHITRALAIMHPETLSHQGMWQSIEEAAPRLAIKAVPGHVHNAAEIERVIASFAQKPDGGLIVLPHALTV